MPRIEYDVVFNIDQASAKRVSQVTSSASSAASGATGGSSSSEVKQQSSAFKELKKQIALVKSEANKASSAFRNSLSSMGAMNKSTIRLSQSAKRQVAAIRTQKGEIRELIQATELTKGETAQLNNAYAQLENREKQIISTIRKHRAELKRTSDAANMMQKSTNGMASQVGAGNKQFASANQLVFSFSDGIQDAAQFSQGFGAGMRAIGNNISFTAELLGNTARNAKEAGVSMKTALKGAITPVTGAILALNVGLTAGQFLWDSWSRSAKEAESELEDVQDTFNGFNSVLDSVTSALKSKDFFGEDPFNIDALEFQKKRTKSEIDEVKSIITSFELTDAEKSRLNNMSSSLPSLSKSEREDYDDLMLRRDNAIPILKEERKNLSALEDTLEEVTQKTREAKRSQAEFNEIMSSEGDGGGEFSDAYKKRLDQTLKRLLEAQKMAKARERALFDNRIALADEFESKRLQLIQDREDKKSALLDIGFSEEKATELAMSEFKHNLRELELSRENEYWNKIVEIRKSAQDRTLEINKSLEQSTRAVNQELIQGIQRTIPHLIESSKGSALALLAIQKALSIGKVIAESSQKIAALRAEQAMATGKASVAIASGNFIQGGALSSAATAIEGNIAAIKGTAGANIAKIAAIGLAQGAGIALGGGSSSGAASGGVSARAPSESANNAFIKREGEVEPPRFTPRNNQGQPTNITVIGNVDKKGIAFAVKEGNKQINAQKIGL